MNPQPGLGQGPHCDDQTDPALGPVLNSFPFTCRPAPSEGAQATCDPFASGGYNNCAYVPIGLFNRFDIAPENGAHCGEYRIVYAKASGISNPDDRNLIIFEAVMPNPLPVLGLLGCRKIAKFWADLSDIDNLNTRADKLERFYFEGGAVLGIPLSPPVVHVNHFGNNANDRGQIRTNQFVNATPRIWSLREFKLKRTCALLGCSAMRMIPATNKENPFGPLFGAPSTHARTPAFQGFLPGQIALLAGANIPDIDEEMPDTYNSGQSQASASTDTNYVTNFGTGPSSLRTALTTALTTAGSALTADDIVKRVQALSCAGCHRLSNNVDIGGGLIWPPSQGFTHVSEIETEVVGGVTRHKISDALVNAFLPHRKLVLQDYLDDTLLLKLIPWRPIGGFYVH